MRTRYRERGFAHTERCEHLGAMPDLYARLTRGLQFRIVFSDRCGNDHDIGIDSGDILGPLTNDCLLYTSTPGLRRLKTSSAGIPLRCRLILRRIQRFRSA